MPLPNAEVERLLRLQLELLEREERDVEGPKYDWYGPPCGCGLMRADGSCPEHPRARPNQRPPEYGGVFVNGSGFPEWENWLILAGRGFGKTRAVCEWL